jgi:hypothetical protein
MGFDPLTLAIVSSVASVGSSLIGSRAQAAQMKAQAQVAAQNQRIAQMNANYAAMETARREQAEAYKTRGLLGQQRAVFAANNLDLNSGSASDVTESTRALANVSFGNIREAGQRQEYGYRAQATQFGNQASIFKSQAPSWGSSLLTAALSGAKTFAASGQSLGGSGSGAPSVDGPSIDAYGVGNTADSIGDIDWSKVSATDWEFSR